ncbi:MGDG synthase family glycosyltransferase [Virgibacillus ainsalahensis]
MADSIMIQLNQSSKKFQYEKVDILSYSFGELETFISSFYLHWIHKLPGLYSQIYRYAAMNKGRANKRFHLYEWLFFKKMEQLIEQTNPDIIICTHALPSYLLQQLKRKKRWTGTVINVYTDYFINNLWGVEEINYHFAPSVQVKNELIRQGVKANRTFVTGIPIHPLFKSIKNTSIKDGNYIVLISGGNMGAGAIQQLLDRLNPSGSVHYKVLCGKNKTLFQYIQDLNHSHIEPVPYLSSREEMNQLYDIADAIITKPGGVTITESLWKMLPIFVYEALPGQEEINLNFLKSQGLIFHLENWETSFHLENEIINQLDTALPQFYKRLAAYYGYIEKKDVGGIIRKILQD